MKQIKAAFDDAARDGGPCGTRLSALLRLALETGKAARDGKSVRAINTLRGKALDAVALATARQEVAAAVEDKGARARRAEGGGGVRGAGRRAEVARN